MEDTRDCSAYKWYFIEELMSGVNQTLLFQKCFIFSCHPIKGKQLKLLVRRENYMLAIQRIEFFLEKSLQQRIQMEKFPSGTGKCSVAMHVSIA